MKQSELKEIAKEAASDYLNDGTNPNQAIERLASKHDLGEGHIERVAHYTNEHINSTLMDKEAYVEFPVARPGNISTKTASVNDAFVPRVINGQEKEAAAEKVAPEQIRKAYRTSGLQQVHEKILSSSEKVSPGGMVDHQNAAMEFENKTGISVDESILEEGEAPDEIESYLVSRYGNNSMGHKQASNKEVIKSPGVFSKIAEEYGADYVPSDNPRRDGENLAKAAAVSMQNAFDHLQNHATKLSAKKEELYEEVKQSRMQGKSLKEIVDALREEGHSDSLLKYIMDRLEAEGLKETSVYDDDGPYSMQRLHRKSAELDPDSPLAKTAREVERLSKEATLDANCVRVCASVLSNTSDLVDAHGSDKEAIKKEAKGWASTIVDKGFDAIKGIGSAGGTAIENIEDIGKGIGNWVKEKPLLRTFELGLGGAAAGELAGRQEDDWKKPKTKAI